jgi:hypothetical protein
MVVTQRALATWDLTDYTGDTSLAGFHIRYKKQGTTAWTTVVTPPDPQQPYLITTGLEPNVNYDFEIRAFDSSANKSAWTALSTNAETPAIVPTISQAIVIQGGGYIESDNFGSGVGFRIDEDSITIHDGNIDGQAITTGVIESNVDTTVNGAIVPLWSINLGGAAVFADLLIRGNTVLGDPADEEFTTLASANYIAGETGWVLRSDGTMEVRGLVAEDGVNQAVISGDVIETGTLRATSLTDSTLGATINLQGTLVATGVLGESVSLGGAGFQVLGAHTAQIVSRSVVFTSGEYRVRLVTAEDHGYAVDSPIVVTGLANEAYNGSWTVRAVPATDVLTYLVPGLSATESSVTETEAEVFGNAGETRTRPVNVNFPTDGTRPNIVSGTLLSDDLVVETSATLGGKTLVPLGASFQIASTIQAPTAAPTVTFSNPDIKFKGDLEYTAGYPAEPIAYISGMTYDNTSNTVFVQSQRAHKTIAGSVVHVISEHNATTGDLIAWRGRFTLAGGLGQSGGIGVYSTATHVVGTYMRWDSGIQQNYLQTVAFDKTTWAGTASSVGFTVSGTRVNYGTVGWNFTDSRVVFMYFASTANPLLGEVQAQVREYTVTAGGHPSNSPTVLENTGTTVFSDLQGVIRGPVGVGGAERYIVIDGYMAANKFRVLNTSRVEQTTESFGGNSSTVYEGIGLRNDSEKSLFVGHSDDADIPYLTRLPGGTHIVAGTTNKDRWIGYSWRDNAGNKETTAKRVKVSMTQTDSRKLMNITIQKAPYTGAGTPDRARVYLSEQSADPGTTAANWKHVGEILYPQTVITVDPAVSYATTPDPLAVSTFTVGGDVGEIITTSGQSFWRGDDEAQFVGLKIVGTEDVDMTSDNTPPLRIGTISGQHLRVDGNEILSMETTTTKGYLGIQGRFIYGLDFGAHTGSANGSNQYVVSHNLGVTPTSAVGTCTATNVNVNLAGKTSTTLTFELQNVVTNATVTAQRTINWFAIAGVNTEPTA